MRLERRSTSCLRASREPVSESERVVFSAAGSAGFFLFQNHWVAGVVEKDLVDEGPPRVSAWRAGRRARAVDGGMAAGAIWEGKKKKKEKFVSQFQDGSQKPGV